MTTDQIPETYYSTCNGDTYVYATLEETPNFIRVLDRCGTEKIYTKRKDGNFWLKGHNTKNYTYHLYYGKVKHHLSPHI